MLKSILEPLLADFQSSLEKARSLLETESISFLSPQAQLDLTTRVQQAQKEVQTAQILLDATNGQVGVEMSVLIPWHRLLIECWQVAMRHRLEKSIPEKLSSSS